MRLQLPWGRQILELEVPDRNVVEAQRASLAPPLGHLSEAVQRSLENPLKYPALRLALTPDDQVAIAVDERLPRLPELLVPILEHVCSAGVLPEAITLVCLPPSTGQAWLEQLPDEFQDVHVEVHQPSDRRKLSYLAATKQGRRIYLNRKAVDADQLILLTGRDYDPHLGISGAETFLYPMLGDEATLQESAARLSLEAPGAESWPIRKEAAEVAWLLGAPFIVQVITGSGEEVLHILSGTVDSSSVGQNLLDARWRVQVDRPVDIVVAGISGDPARHSFEDLARAFFSAARVVKPGGHIVLLTEAQPGLGRAAKVMRQHHDPLAALKVLLKEKPADLTAGFLWASAADRAKLVLLSALPGAIVEEMFVTPLDSPNQVHRLLGTEATCLVLPDAHKTLAVLTHAKMQHV